MYSRGRNQYHGSMKALNERQKRFAQEYMLDLNATKAAIRAGYSAKTAYSIGHRLLTKVEINNEIKNLRQQQCARTSITADRVLAEIASVAFADIGDYVRIGEDGTPYVDFSAASEVGTKAIASVDQEVYVTGNEETPPVKRTKIRLHDKLGALDKLCRHLGLYKDSLQIAGSVEVTDARAELVRRLSDQARRSKHPAGD